MVKILRNSAQLAGVIQQTFEEWTVPVSKNQLVRKLKKRIFMLLEPTNHRS